MKKKMAFGTVVFGAVTIVALGLQAIGGGTAYAVPTVTDVVKFQGTATLTEASSTSTQHFNLSFSQAPGTGATGGCFNLKTLADCTLTLASGATVTGCPAPSNAFGTFTITEGTATTTVTIDAISFLPPKFSVFVAGQGGFVAPADKSSIVGSPDSIAVGELVAIPNGPPEDENPCDRDGMSVLTVTVAGEITVTTTS